MPKVKRIVERPFGKRRKGGWVIQRLKLIEALKKGEAVELDKVVVGTKQLLRLINLLPYDDCVIRANGRLEVETVERYIKRTPTSVKTHFRKPKHYHQFMAIVNGAWIPRGATKVVVLRPRKF